jgi:hypothetical protein
MTSNPQQSGRHRADLLSLIFGLIFLVCGGAWAVQHFFDLPWRIDWSLPGLGWVLAGGLVLAGLLGILASLRRERPAPPELAAPTESQSSARTPEAGPAPDEDQPE